MHCFHPTPQHIVQKIINRHFLPSAKRILEPSIGDGALLKGLNLENKKVTCIDIDKNRISNAKTTLSNIEAELIPADFLSLDFGCRKFDLILCNPPFDIKNTVIHESKKLPVEAAFLLKASNLCTENGRMIFILPSSVTRGTRLKWLRELILGNFKLSFSYKLPDFTFNKVEGDFSVLIFDKSKRNKKSKFVTGNYTFTDFYKNIKDNNISFDAEEIANNYKYQKFIFDRKFEMSCIDDLFQLKRGSITTNYKRENVIHTTNSKKDIIPPCIAKTTIKKGDWLIHRVSRNIIQSIREYNGSPALFTDCIIRLRPKNDSQFNEIFYSLCIALQICEISKIVIKGSGAKYLDLTTLKSIKIPTNLHKTYRNSYKLFLISNDKRRIEIAKNVAFMISNNHIETSDSRKSYSNTHQLNYTSADVS